LSIYSTDNNGNPKFHPFTTIAWVMGLGLLFLAIWVLFAGLIFGFRVATAGIVGKGEAEIRIESANNRIEKQELFEILYADVRAYDDQINVTFDTLSSVTDDEDIDFYRQILNGQKNQCIDATNQYNAEARKISSEQFRDSELPYQIDSLNPDFDCEEDNA
jgi:hypothetical protein